MSDYTALPVEAQEHLRRCATPAHLAMTATADLADDVKWKPARHLMYLNEIITAACLSPRQEFIDLELSVRHGKALALDTPVPTPAGWSTIGALKPGDEVFDENGEVCRVVAKSRVFKDRPCFTVTTDDGDRIVADAEHEWPVHLSDSYHNREAPPTSCPLCPFTGKPHGVTMHMVRAHGTRPSVMNDVSALSLRTSVDLSQRRSRFLAKGRSDRPRSPMRAALKTEAHHLPVDPWMLGFWLGDGTTIFGSVTIGPQDRDEVCRLIEASGYRVSPHANGRTFGVLGLKVDLRSAGVLGNKHVPIEYLRSSPVDRLALLQGLVDSDGYVAPKGQVEFCSTKRCLAEAVQELVRSLGYKASLNEGRATLNGKDCGPKYRVMFYMPDAARLERKRSRCIEPKRRDRFLTVEPCAPSDTQCIQVDSPSHLFLAGRGLVPTHNSFLVSGYTAAWYIGMFPDRRVALLSYNADKAAEWGEFTMEIIAEWGPTLFGISLDPNKRSKGNWGIKGRRGEIIATGLGGTVTGKGFDLCLDGDSVVTTEHGDVTIRELVEGGAVGTLVLSWNHEVERPEWRPIVATKESLADGLVEVSTTSGRSIRCTPGHRVYRDQFGYGPAGDLGGGETLYALPSQHPLPEVRGDERWSGRRLSALLPRVAGSVRSSGLRSVLRTLHAAAVRHSQGQRQGVDPRLLLGGLSGCMDVGPRQEEVLGVRSHPPQEHPSTVRCLQDPPAARAQSPRSDRLPAVRGPVSSTIDAPPVLLQDVCGRGPLGPDEGEGQLTLQDGRFLQQVVQDDASPHHRARLWLRRLWRGRQVPRPSHQRGRSGQPAGEPRDALPHPPCDPPWIERDTVALVRDLRRAGQPVYDIQVEGNRNFFAGGILVHNCVIDDPIKNREDADSAAERKKLRDGYYSNVRTRLSPHGTVVLAMARWREDDLAGDVVHGYNAADDLTDAAGDVDEWNVVRFPALAECPQGEDPKSWRDELGRADGDPLWPELWPKELVEKMRNTMLRNDPQAWYSLYQQNPTSKEGRDFKKDKWVIFPEVDRSRLRLVRQWDLAATKDGGDWTVGALVGMDNDGKTYVLDIQRFRKESSEVEKHIRLTAENDGIAIPVRIEQEKSGSGKAVASTYTRLLVGFDVQAKQPEGNKEVRASAYAAQQQQERVVLLRAPWNDDFIEEHRMFPKGRWDDQVDAVSAGFNNLAIAGPTVIEATWQGNTPLASLYGNHRGAADPIAAARARVSR